MKKYIAHHEALANFRLNEWPKSAESYTLFYNQHMAIHNLVPTIDFLSDVLYGSRCSLVRHSIFTLVNVSMPKDHLSYGTMPIPNKSLYGLSNIVFTFAYTPKIRYDYDVRPKFMMRVGKNAYLWGTSLSHSTDYLTIYLPNNIFQSLRIGTLTSDIEFLYYVIGPWSKNFVRHNRYYSSTKYDLEAVDLELMHSTVFYQPIPNLLHQFSYDKWIYNRELWKRLPSIFSTRIVNDDFCAYYCRYLTAFYKKYTASNVKEIEELVESYLKTEVLDFLELLRNPYAYDTPSTLAYTPASTLAYMLTKKNVGLKQFSFLMAEAQKERLIAKFSDVENTVRDLLLDQIRI